ILRNVCVCLPCSLLLLTSYLSSHLPHYLPSLPSLPTRRSSDLLHVGAGHLHQALHGEMPIHNVKHLTIFKGKVLQGVADHAHGRSEEHTSELQSRFDLVCRLLLEKKKYDGHTSTAPRAWAVNGG